jgi:uncharacterized protein (UPF0548 family)
VSAALTPPFTYSDVGRTSPGAELPAGYRHVLRRARVGSGEPAFAAVASSMREWGIHRGAGLRVRADGPPAEDVRFATGIGVGPLRLWVPCRVVWVCDEPRRYGYGFGTLPGHPARGEEAFLVTRAADDEVWFEVRAFSRPASWYARLGRPAANLLQDRVTDRYAAAALPGRRSRRP